LGQLIQQPINGTVLDVEDRIVLASCDPQSGYIDSTTNLANLASQKALAVILYSQSSQGCLFNLSNRASLGPLTYLYSFRNLDDTTSVLTILKGTIPGSFIIPQNGPSGFVTIERRDTMAQNNNGTANYSPTSNSPTTAVAMIILYSITGVITALFLIIIVTGAIRAHRHPERYGPRAGLGRPRQSRAKGIARAMLETLPIKKWGDEKPADVEMAGGSTNPTTSATANDLEKEGDDANQKETSDATSPDPVAVDNAGCSICTDDFEKGQDVRVLPCNHQFHPACIDPWLLNVSGTCPLWYVTLSLNFINADPT
jgi:hypothetical protein